MIYLGKLRLLGSGDKIPEAEGAFNKGNEGILLIGDGILCFKNNSRSILDFKDFLLN